MTRRPPAQPTELSARRAARLFGRALLLRCPNCGGRPIFASPLRLRDHCPHCGMHLERGEHDYFLGAYLFNLVAVELLFALALLVTVVATWPDPPWDLIEYGGLALMVVGAVLCYPLAKVVWLAFDLMLRPLEPGEASALAAVPPADRAP